VCPNDGGVSCEENVLVSCTDGLVERRTESLAVVVELTE
jgi:hypothetical protein